MKKTLCILFAVMAILCAAAVVYADQEGSSCWCNNDQYGCWITGEKGERSYIMFWAESARDYIMGKGSNAPIVEKYSKGNLPLECGIVRSTVVVSAPAAGSTDQGQPEPAIDEKPVPELPEPDLPVPVIVPVPVIGD